MNKNLSAEFCSKNSLIILNSDKETVTIGIIEKLVEDVAERLERYFLPEKKVIYKCIEKDEFEVRLTRLYSGAVELSKNSKIQVDEEITNAANATPIVNLLNSIISEGILKKVSDIHIDVNKANSRIRCRKDGKLEDMLFIEKKQGETLIGRIKLLANLNILECRRCQDGRFDYIKNDFSFDIRVSIIPSIHGESVVLRLLGGDIRVPELETLGFSKTQLSMIYKMIKIEHGLILVTGPTGSGKTTTLASLISRINSDDVQIITIEDPVEYRINGALQISVDEEIGQSFFEILKRVLRHDPDVLMIGEIRDEETAAMACRMALTGHLVFASIHTNNCRETFLRLVDMGIPSYIVKAVLKGVISQKLIEKKCGGRTVDAELCYFETQEEINNLCAVIS